ncbi:hypothetical protein [Rhizobium leguminosarum]
MIDNRNHATAKLLAKFSSLRVPVYHCQYGTILPKEDEPKNKAGGATVKPVKH